jgi:hypothetical protein
MEHLVRNWIFGYSIRSIKALPLIIGAVALIIFLITYREIRFIFPDYIELPDGVIKQNQATAIGMINELNKFLLSINTTLFGFAGFFLNNYKSTISSPINGIAYFIALILLSIGLFFAFKVYTELLSNLSQNSLDINPETSRILFYLRMEFEVCCSSTLTLLAIFVSVFFQKPK